MAFFKFRWPGRGGQDDTARAAGAAGSRGATPPESVDMLRRRARHRLIGAAVLLVAGVVGFPVLFDTQPRPIPVDIPIAIPGRDQAPALVLPGAQTSQGAETPANVAQAAAASPAPAPAPAVSAKPPAAPRPSLAAPPLPPMASNTPAPAPAAPAVAPAPAAPSAATAPARTIPGLDAGEEVIASSRKPAPAPKPEAKPKPETRPEAHAEAKPKPEAKPEAKPAAPSRSNDAARALALLEGRPQPVASAAASSAATPAAATEGRFVVQVGAFSDLTKAQEARDKLSHGGLKTYMQSVDTKDGKRHRVRVGPFGSRAEADKAAGRVKGLDLPASVLTL